MKIGIKVLEFGKYKDTINDIAVNPVDVSTVISVSDDMRVRLFSFAIHDGK